MTDYDIIKSIVDRGIAMMKNDLSEQQFDIWKDFARSMLNITGSRSIQTTQLGFLQVLLSLNTNRIEPYQKLNTCIRYFLEVMKRGI